TITGRNLSSVDLNLLLVLHTVLSEGSATAAAKRLSVSQSAVSNSLARLREVLGDPLVVRHGRGLTPTPLAQRLAPALAAAVGHPTVGATLTREQFNQLPHIDTHVALGKPGMVHKVAADLFARHGLSRRIVLSVPHFSSAAMTAARTDCLAALPERIARLFCSL